MIGVLVMAYGGPNTLAEVALYLLDVRGLARTATLRVRLSIRRSDA